MVEYLINIGLLDKANNTIVIVLALAILTFIIAAFIIKKFISTLIAILVSTTLSSFIVAKVSFFNQFPVSLNETGVTVNDSYIPYKDIRNIKFDPSSGTMVITEPDGTKNTIKIDGSIAEAVFKSINERALVKWQ